MHSLFDAHLNYIHFFLSINETRDILLYLFLANMWTFLKDTVIVVKFLDLMFCKI